MRSHLYFSLSCFYRRTDKSSSLPPHVEVNDKTRCATNCAKSTFGQFFQEEAFFRTVRYMTVIKWDWLCVWMNQLHYFGVTWTWRRSAFRLYPFSTQKDHWVLSYLSFLWILMVRGTSKKLWTQLQCSKSLPHNWHFLSIWRQQR